MARRRRRRRYLVNPLLTSPFAYSWFGHPVWPVSFGNRLRPVPDRPPRRKRTRRFIVRISSPSFSSGRQRSLARRRRPSARKRSGYTPPGPDANRRLFQPGLLLSAPNDRAVHVVTRRGLDARKKQTDLGRKIFDFPCTSPRPPRKRRALSRTHLLLPRSPTH